ncbi:MAG: leucine-rich repeat protein, partial [Clostridia bacterium]|nr:leucine-rich repeat protein [Clostridia bacterium]
MKINHTGTLKTGRLCAAVLLIAALLVCLVAGAAAEDTPFTYTVTDGRAVITGINSGFSGALTIPESVDGYPVTEIADGAFSGCTAITSVSLPSSVTVIGNSAFYGCTGLTQADIPAGVLDIGENAFEGCSNIASVTLSDDITVMKKGVFKNCTSLKTMTPVKRVKVTGVTLDETLTVSHKETAALTAEVAPSNASNKALIWSSSDETVATVVNGNVTGVYPGEAVITCAAADNKQITASCTVTVTPVAPEEITSEDITVKMNDYAVPNLYFTPEYAMATLTFESADPEVATVDAESGLITGVFVGQTTITVTADNGVTCTVNVTVECSGHEPVTDEAVEPKCEEPGKTEGSHCSVCG